jgi:hypothetical protein
LTEEKPKTSKLRTKLVTPFASAMANVKLEIRILIFDTANFTGVVANLLDWFLDQMERVPSHLMVSFIILMRTTILKLFFRPW